MKTVPFAIIQAAKECDPEAVDYIKKHFEGYIASQCLTTVEDELGRIRTCVDEDLRYQAEIGLFAAIFKFRFKEPPADFPA